MTTFKSTSASTDNYRDAISIQLFINRKNKKQQYYCYYLGKLTVC